MPCSIGSFYISYFIITEASLGSIYFWASQRHPGWPIHQYNNAYVTSLDWSALTTPCCHPVTSPWLTSRSTRPYPGGLTYTAPFRVIKRPWRSRGRSPVPDLVLRPRSPDKTLSGSQFHNCQLFLIPRCKSIISPDSMPIKRDEYFIRDGVSIFSSSCLASDMTAYVALPIITGYSPHPLQRARRMHLKNPIIGQFY